MMMSTSDPETAMFNRRRFLPAASHLPFIAPFIALCALPLVPLMATAQQETEDWIARCERQQRDAERSVHCEVREATIPVPARLDVEASPNGGVSVRAAERNDVHVTARVQTWATTEATARELAQRIRIETSEGRIRAEGPRNTEEQRQGWSVSFVVSAPGRIDLAARTVNGGVDVSGITGDVNLQTVNGGIHLEGVDGEVEAHTTNGGIEARLANGWRGESVSLHTTNGAISLAVPEGFAAALSASTVHGAIETDFPVTVQGRIGRSLTAQIGGGGPPVRLATTNGAISIRRR